MVPFLVIGGSDAGISAALRIKEIDPKAQVTVMATDAYPNFSICGLPFYLSGAQAGPGGRRKYAGRILRIPG